MEAKIEDHKADVKLTGDEAITKLSPLLQELKFDKDTADQEVIDQVVNVFKLDKDYQKFDLEVVFSDGTKKNIKRNKEVGGCLLLYFAYLKSGLDPT